MDTGLQVGLLHRVDLVDPHRSLAYAAGMVERQIFESLYRRSDGQLVPQFLAGHLKEVNGSYEGELRADLKWSDGNEVTAQEVCASLRRSDAMPGAPEFESEGRCIRISSEAPLLAIREMLAFAGTFLVKPAPREDDQNALIGTGPYMVDTMSEALRLVRNPHHAGPRAAIESITFRDYANEAELADAVAKANVDFTVALAPKDLPAGSFVRTSYLPTPSTAILFMNAERLPDSRLRQAIAMSIERSRLLDLGYPGATGLSAKGTLPASLGHCADQVLHNPQGAGRLLATAGVKPDRPLKLLVIWGQRPYLPRPLAAGEELVRQLSLAGLPIELSQTRDPEHHTEVITAGDFDLALGGWYADDPSPSTYLTALYASANIPKGEYTAGKSNFGRWSDPQCDAALRALRDDPTNTERIDEIARIVRAACPSVALHHGAATVALGRRIRGREFDALGIPCFASFTMRR